MLRLQKGSGLLAFMTNIAHIFDSKKGKVFSFEIFPPRRTDPVHTIYETVAQLRDLHPDYISVTYGAGGSENSAETLQIATMVKDVYGIESAAHLPGINLNRSEVLALLGELKAAGIKNILALRGDGSSELEPGEDFRFASDLISFIKENGDFHVIAACYPEGHRECASIDHDIRNLKTKVDAGADQLITQLFFDNNDFYAFRDRAERAGIEAPIQAGIMPVTRKAQAERMVTMCGAGIPPKLRSILDKYGDNPEDLRAAGVAYATEQIADLAEHEVDGVHLYTMNNAKVAHQVHAAVGNLFTA
jgi:methylenetetrahydrofolate reductase (NADPH)